MAQEVLVETVNKNLRAQRDEAVGHRENPRLIAVINEMIRLTNSEEDNAIEDAANVPVTQSAPAMTADQIIALYKAGKLSINA